MPRQAAVSSTLISSTARNTNTVRKASGSRLILSSIRRRVSAQGRAFGLFGRVSVHLSLRFAACFAWIGRIGDQVDHLGAAVELARAPDCHVDRNADQPRRQFRVAAKVVHGAIGQHIGFLHGVLGLGIVLEDAARGAVERLVVPSHQVLKRGHVSRRDPFGQLGVGQVLDGGHRQCLLHESLPLIDLLL